MKKLPITLCIITKNSEDRIANVINKHSEFVSETIVVNQSSEDKTAERASEAGALVVNRRTKGTSDPDRNWTFDLANYPWVLYLDDDEFLDVKDIKDVENMMNSGVDAIWLKRRNLVDGIDISSILGDDMQCRLFKKGATIWPSSIHTYPQPAEHVCALYSDMEIVHERTLEGLKSSNRGRDAIATKEQIANQENFIKQVEEFMTQGMRQAI